MKKLVICLIALFVFTSIIYSQPLKPVGIQAVQHPSVRAIYFLVNKERIKAGETPLVEDPRLNASAQTKCEDMSRLNERAHNLSDGRIWQSFFAPELQNAHIGENLVEDASTSQIAVNSWMGSPGHRANILDASFSKVGYAVCNGSWVVQQFLG